MTVAELTVGTIPTGNGPYINGTFAPAAYGQSITPTQTVSGPRFRWLDDKGNGVAVAGTMAILTRVYGGLPADIPSAPGFVATSSTIDGGTDFVFDESVVLTQGVKYWFLESTPAQPTVWVDGQLHGIDAYPGGEWYSAGTAGPYIHIISAFSAADLVDANFRVSGHPR